MKLIPTLILIGTTVFLSSCIKDEWGCVHGHGSTISEERIEDLFNQLEINLNANVFVFQDEYANYTTVEIRGQENIIDEITTDVSGNTMQIDFEDCARHYKDLNIYLTVKDLNSLEINGSSDVYFENTMHTNYFSIEIDGSGDASIDVVTSNLKTNIDGSGDINFDGVAASHTISINGSGDISAYGLSTENTDVNINGSGDCKVKVSDNLDINISGSGDIYYKGNPDVSININGSGDITHIN